MDCHLFDIRLVRKLHESLNGGDEVLLTIATDRPRRKAITLEVKKLAGVPPVRQIRIRVIAQTHRGSAAKGTFQTHCGVWRDCRVYSPQQGWIFVERVPYATSPIGDEAYMF